MFWTVNEKLWILTHNGKFFVYDILGTLDYDMVLVIIYYYIYFN